MTDQDQVTLTSRFAAVQFKMLHLQLRMRKIYLDQKALSEATFDSNRERIRGLLPASYTFMDMLVSLEHAAELMRDIFATEELRGHFDKGTYEIINRTKKAAEKWRPIRNCIGGHLDLDIVEQMCERNNFRGVFLSDDLECDLAVLNMLLLETAVNSTRNKRDVIGRDLDMKHRGVTEMQVLVSALNNDWNTVFSYFEPLMELMYRVGKQEKIYATTPEERRGIVIGD